MNNHIVFEHNLPEGKFVIYKDKPATAIEVKQIHSNKIVSLSAAQNTLQEADGLVWSWDIYQNSNENITPLIKTADCLPLVILGKRGGCILHAGWKGIQSQIHLQPEVKQLEPYFLYIGPSIQASSFEVTSEFLNFFDEKHLFSPKNDRYTFNLQEKVKLDLNKLFPKLECFNSNIDTFTDLRFHSYRRSKGSKINNYNTFIYHRGTK